jgi:hypothetical protein
MSLRRIISGAQTGVDRAALDSARAMGLYEWGGWCPKGRLDENGEIPDIYFNSDRLNCGLREAESSRYTQRTALNVIDSDATLILKSGIITPGTKLTIKVCRRKTKYYVICDPSKSYNVKRAVKFIVEQGVEVLNVAGPRESSRPGIYDQSKIFITDILHMVFQFQQFGIKIWDPKPPKGKI